MNIVNKFLEKDTNGKFVLFSQRLKDKLENLNDAKFGIKGYGKITVEETDAPIEKSVFVKVDSDDISAEDIVLLEFNNFLISQIFKIPEIKWLIIKEDTIDIVSKNIVIPHNHKIYDIGEFFISINFKAKDIKLFNLTRRVSAYRANQQHPNVWQNGSLVTGEHDETLKNLIESKAISPLIQMLFIYLKSVNSEDTIGRHIDKWPTI